MTASHSSGSGPRPSGLSIMFQWPPSTSYSRRTRPSTSRGRCGVPTRIGARVSSWKTRSSSAASAGRASLWNEEGFTGPAKHGRIRLVMPLFHARNAARTHRPDASLSDRAARALADARPVPFWTDRPERPDPRPALTRAAPRTDLLVVGGGFTGLWAALQAKEADPSLDVVVVEAGRLADSSLFRAGGGIAATLVTGVQTGALRISDDALEVLGGQAVERAHLV